MDLLTGPIPIYWRNRERLGVKESGPPIELCVGALYKSMRKQDILLGDNFAFNWGCFTWSKTRGLDQNISVA